LRSALVALGGLWLSGCLPSAQSQLDEEKEPHFLAGKSRVYALDYRGAVEAFERALEVNPQSASAHFELACLYEQRESDPAAAIYHYDHYLKLRPGAGNAEVVKGHIMTCKQELARTVSLGPVTEKQQRDLDQMAEENRRLGEENKRLRDEVEKWRAFYAGRPVALSNPPPTASSVTRVAPPPSPVLPPPAPVAAGSATSTGRAVAAPAARTHAVKAGETPIVIARKYGVKVEALLAANPGLDVRHLQVGQSLTIPGP
jgi:LysM repeat protein